MSAASWSLTNVGKIYSTYNQEHSADIYDPSDDEYDMKWTYTATLVLKSGDTVDFIVNPEYNGIQYSTQGDAQGISYLSANITPAFAGPPTVTASGSTGQTFTVGSAAVLVDSGLTVTSSDTDITGASMAITNKQTGDTLNFTSQNGITGNYNSSTGTLSLSGTATPAQYRLALESVTFSTTSLNTATRTVDVVADDSAASPTNSNTAVDNVKVAIGAPVVTANQTSVSATAGQKVTVDSALTVSSYDSSVTGAKVTIGTGYQSGLDTLNFTSQNGITGSYSSGTLTLAGSATPAQYQAALRSVAFSSTSTSTAARTISIVVSDAGDTGNTNSNAASTQIAVSAPVTIAALYVKGSTWSTSFDNYLGSHTLGNSSTPSLGYALQTGSSQLTVLPWNKLNTITVQFSGPVSDVGQNSLVLVGGSGGSTPTVTGFASDGNNTYSWTLSGFLTDNQYLLAIATTGSSFGTPGSTQVTDSNGAPISGTFANSSSSFPSGNGLAGGSFNFLFNVLPGDGSQGGTVNSTDSSGVTSRLGDTTSNTSYSPYYDYQGEGVITSIDSNLDTEDQGDTLPSAAPAAPSIVVTPSGSTASYTAGGSAVYVDAGITISTDMNLTGATVTISAGTLLAGDTLSFTSQNGITGSYTSGTGVLTLAGSASPAQYQAALQSVKFSSTSTNATTKSLSIVAIDSGLDSNAAAESIDVSVPAPVVTTSGSTGRTFTLGSAAVAVDSGLTVSSYDTDLTGATETITNDHSGDTLNFSSQNGITGSFNSGTGVLTLTGSATPAQYQTALQSVTFSTTSSVKGTRTIDVVADDSAASPTTSSNTGVDTVGVAIAAPIVTASDFQTLSSFNGTVGGVPFGSLTLSGSTLYGMTSSGGEFGDGTIFSVPVTGGTPTVLASFNGTDGNQPLGSLTLSGSTLYGMTTLGGIYSQGNIFSIPVTGGTPTNLHSFDGTDGDSPSGSLTLSGSTLYGMTSAGGTFSDGNIFSINTSGSGFANLFSFNGTNGFSPFGSLTLSGSTLYGMTSGGGTDFDGNVFSINTSGGGFANLLTFDGANGALPYGDLTLSGSTLYGMTTGDGTDNYGTIFAIPVTGGSPTILTTFSGANVATPYGDLTLSGSTLYGMTFGGGSQDDGNIFSIPLSGGTPTTLVSFNGTNGETPYGSLTLSGSTLYGMTNSGGAAGDGTIFSLKAAAATINGGAVAVDSAVTVSSYDTDLTGASLSITNVQSGDTLHFTSQNGITGSFNSGSGVLTLAGSATPAQYQTALQSITFSTTSSNTAPRTINLVADDSNDTGNVTSNTALDSVDVGIIAAPVVTASGSTGQTFTLGSAAVAVDSGLTVTSNDTDITGASLTITSVHSGDTLHFSSQNGITGSFNSGTGVLTLSGSATPAQYQTALQSVTFSTTSLNTATRTIDVVADDSAASPSTSNTAVDSVVVAIAAPVVTASGGTGQTFTVGGAAVAVDSGVTVSSYDTDLTGATETITNTHSGDTLNFTSQNGITGSFNSGTGVLTLAGSATPAQYQTALQSVTFSTTSIVKGTRTIDVVALDSSDTGDVSSNTGVDTVVVAIAAPLVTTWNVNAKFVANGSGDGGETAFGDNATKTAAQLGGAHNNSTGTGAVTASDTATSTSPWTFGTLDSGPSDFANNTAYSFSTYVDPNSFDNYITGANDPAWSPGHPGGAADGTASGYPGLAGYAGGTGYTSAVSYNYGNAGLNGNGSGSAVPDDVDGYVAIPTGAVLMSAGYGPAAAKFTAPAAGTYTLTTTLTDPYFDPFDGPGGGNYLGDANDAWAWDAGQADFAIFDVPAGSTEADNTSSLLADGFWSDIASVNAGETPSSVGSASNRLSIVGQTYTVANGGLSINTGAGGLGPGGQYGSGGTWSLTNVGSALSDPSHDLTGDEYDMTWTVTKTVTLGTGDSIDIVANPEYLQGEDTGDYVAPIYLSATMTNAAVVTSSGTPNTFTVGGAAVAVDSGVTVTSSDTDITGASLTITNYHSGDTLNFTSQNGITGSFNSGSGVLTLSGSATPAQYTRPCSRSRSPPRVPTPPLERSTSSPTIPTTPATCPAIREWTPST